MKIVITGADGKLGRALIKKMPFSHEVIPLSTALCDVRDKASVYRILSEKQPDVVIHCAAYTAVDKAESNVEVCRDINLNGSIYIAHACEALQAKMVLISTDYVFDGEGYTPYETEMPTNPLNVYGRSKADAEKEIQRIVSRCFIVRTSWMFGDGPNFVRTMRRLAEERDSVSVVSDQIGSPTYSEDLASLLIAMVETELYGIYHATNEGYCSWADLAEQTIHYLKLDSRVKRVFAEEFPLPARRPRNSRLSKDCLERNGFLRLPDWRDALKQYLLDHEGALKIV